MHFLPETRVTPLMAIRRERLLPVRGEVLVRVGEWVEAMDVVARAELPSQRRVVDVASSLRVPADRAEQSLRKGLGDRVEFNEILATHKGPLGLFRQSCRAPDGGTIAAVQGGMILLETEPKPLELRAHLRGQVVNVMPDRGVVISTSGAWIQGVFGNAKEANGVLKAVVTDPAAPLRAQDLDANCRDSIVVAGTGVDEGALRAAEEYEVRGLVLGSLDAALYSLFKGIPYPVMVTEGMGRVRMSRPIFELLTAHDGREASMSTMTQARWGAVRPEIIIPLLAEDGQPEHRRAIEPLAPGAVVRIVRQPYMGLTGQVVQVPALARPVESGVRLHLAQVEVEGAGVVSVPVLNLELIR
jgi:hypothetical protein